MKNHAMQFNRFITCAIAAGTLLASIPNAHAAGVPVFDAASVEQALQNIAAWKKQFDQMKSSLDQMKHTYDALNGIRGMADLVNNPALRAYLPADYQDMLKGINMAASISGQISNIRDAAQLSAVADTALGAATDAARAMANAQNQNALNRATGEEGYKMASDRFKSIQILLDKINAAPDQKDILDLQARISAEQAMLANEKVKLDMMSYLSNVQRDIQQQQAREIAIKATKGGIPRF